MSGTTSNLSGTTINLSGTTSNSSGTTSNSSGTTSHGISHETNITSTSTSNIMNTGDINMNSTSNTINTIMNTGGTSTLDSTLNSTSTSTRNSTSNTGGTTATNTTGGTTNSTTNSTINCINHGLISSDSMDIYCDPIDDVMAGRNNTGNTRNTGNDIDMEMLNNIDMEMLKAQEEAANAFQSIISQIENQISPEQKELLNELSIEDQEIFLMTLMSLENDEIEGDVGMDVDVEDLVDHATTEDHIQIVESTRIDSGHVGDMASDHVKYHDGIASNSSVNSTIGGTVANHLTFIPQNTVTTTSTNQNMNTDNCSTSIHTDGCNNHVQNDNVKSILEKLSFLQNSLSNLHENNHLNLLNDNNNEFLSALTLQVESLQKSQLQLENNSISTPGTAPSNIDTAQGNRSLKNTLGDIQNISQSNTQNHIHQKNYQHSSISIPSHTLTKMNVKSSGLDSIENINGLEIDQMKNSPISSNDMLNSMAALDSMELIPGSKEQALFALYVAHYQREALKMMQNSTQNNLETPNPSLATLSNTTHIDSSNIATSHLLKSTFQIPSQVSLSQKAIPQNIDQIASLNHQKNNNTPISTVASGSEMMDPILALSLQPLQALPATAQPFIDINDMETMNAVMQQALQAALQQNMVDENQVNANTMALNEALTAASHQSTNGVQGATTIDLNGIDLTGVDLDNFDFSNIDLSNVDFSQMDFSGIDFNMPSFDPANIDAKVMETVTRFDVDGKPFVNLDPTSNGSTNPTTAATSTAQKATGVKKEKKERKPAAPKEPKPPRVKAPQGPQICPTCHKTYVFYYQSNACFIDLNQGKH